MFVRVCKHINGDLTDPATPRTENYPHVLISWTEKCPVGDLSGFLILVTHLGDIYTVAHMYTPALKQSEHIGQWATPHRLSDVRRGAPSWIWDYLAHSDIIIYV